MKLILIGLIKFYQKVISPWTISSCRFHPTCSQYTKLALQKYGFCKGLWLGLKRVLKCHPFHSGGYDPLE